jgi:hypothetical protein
MFRAFLEDTLNIAEAPETGERLPGGSLDRAREFAIRLQHWLPAFMEIPDDLAAVAEEYESEAESQDEDQQPSAAEVKAAAELMVRFARRFLDSDRFGEDRTQGGRIQTAVGYRATVKFQRGLKRFFGSFEIPGQATDVFPGFTSGSEPYFEFHDSETDINEGSDVLVHYVKGKDNRYVDLGRR